MFDVKNFSEVFPFWNNLTSEEAEEAAANTVIRRAAPGEIIHRSGYECTGVLAVISGRLRSFMMSAEGKEITLFRLIEGDCCILSASCMMKNISFDLNVSSEVDTELAVLSPVVYEKIAKKNPHVEGFMNDIIAMRFSEVMWVMEQLIFMKMDRRIAIFLLEQSSLEGGDTVTLTHEQIAGHIGTAREVVSRMLKYFSNEGLISVSRKGIIIIDRKALINISG